MGVLGDGAVGRKRPHARHVEDGLARPGVGVAVEGVHLVLGFHITGVVGQQQVGVAPVHQGIEDLLVAAGFLRAENTALDGVQHMLEAGVGHVQRTRLVAAGAQGGHLGGGVAEDEDVLGPHVLSHLHIGAVEGADGECAAQRKLHVAGARGLGASGGYLLRQVGRRHDDLGQAHAVVGYEHHLEQAAHALVVVDGGGHVVDEPDDQLGHGVGAGGLAREHHHARHMRTVGLGQDALVAGDDVQHVEQLALVLVDALDLHVEQGAGVQRDVQVLLHPLGQPVLVLLLGMAEGGHERRLRGHGAQGFELGQVAPPAFAQALVEQAGQGRVGLGQPAAGRDAVGLVVEARGEDASEVGKDGLRHQLGVQGRYTVDGMAHQHRQVGHAHPALAGLVHQRYAAQQLGVVAVLLRHAGEEARVHVEDDLQVARQDAAHHLHRPGLQRLVHQRVVGVREDLLCVAPGGVPVEAVFVDQQAQQLGHGQHRVGVVEVDADLLGQLVEGVVGAQVAAQQVLHAGRAEEVFLVQAQLAAGRGGVVGVKHPRHVLGLVLALHRREVAAAVEG